MSSSCSTCSRSKAAESPAPCADSCAQRSPFLRRARWYERLEPRVVLSVGGYASGPAGIAGWSLRVPVAILAPDLVLGLANRWLAPFARRAYVSFRETETKLPRGIAIRTGVPLRGAFPAEPLRACFRAISGAGRRRQLGAPRRSTTRCPRALAEVARQVPNLSILHQVGRDREIEVTQAYQQLGLAERASVTPFIEDVASELAGADLFIGRAGAGAIAELCAVGRPSILVPLPNVGVINEKTPKLWRPEEPRSVSPRAILASRLSTEVLALARDDERRVKLADAARELGRPQAAREIARDLLELAGIARRPGPAGVSPASEAANGYTAGRGRTHQAGAAHV